MRKHFAVLIALLISLALLSCKAGESTTSLRVNIDRGKRTISPTASQLNIQTFVIYTTGPDGKSGIQKTVYSDSTTLEGLKIGEWTIRVEGKNTEGTIIATGENKIMLSSANNLVEVSLTDLYGKGNLDLEFRWDNKRITNTKLEASMKAQGSDEVIALSDKLIKDSDYTYSLQMSSLDSGSYVMTGSLYSENTKVGGFTEAIRISNGVTTKGVISLGLDKIINTEVGFSNLTSVPIECKIEGITELIPSRESINATVKITTSNITDSSLKCEWYLDGVSVGSGRTISITPEPGDHRLDVVVSTEHNGSLGSDAITFTAANLFKGLPYRLNTYKSDDNLMLSGRTLVKIVPDNNKSKINSIMIISRDRKYLQTLLMSESGYKISQSQSLTDSSWNYKYEVNDVVFYGEPLKGTLYATVLCNGPLIATYQYNTSSALLNNKAIVSIGAQATSTGTITNFGYGAYLSESKFIFTHGYNPDTYSQGILTLNAHAGESSGDWSKYVNYNLNTYPNAKLNGVPYSGGSTLAATNGTNSALAAIGRGLLHAYTYLKTSSDGSTKTVLVMNGIEDAGGEISGLAVAGDVYLLALVKPSSSTSEIQVYKYDRANYKLEKVTAFSNSGSNYKLLASTSTTGYLYTLDEENKQIVALSFNQATQSFSIVGAVTIPDAKYNAMDISDDGTMLVLYDKNSADRITVLNVKVTD